MKINFLKKVLLFVFLFSQGFATHSMTPAQAGNLIIQSGEGVLTVALASLAGSQDKWHVLGDNSGIYSKIKIVRGDGGW